MDNSPSLHNGSASGAVQKRRGQSQMSAYHVAVCYKAHGASANAVAGGYLSHHVLTPWRLAPWVSPTLSAGLHPPSFACNGVATASVGGENFSEKRPSASGAIFNLEPSEYY